MPMGPKGRKLMEGFMSRFGKKRGKSVAFATANKKGKGSGLYALLHKGK